MVVLSWHRSLIWKKVHLSRLAIVGNRLVWFFYIGQNRWVFHIGWYRPIPIIFPISTDTNFKWPKPIDLATSYSYNSGGHGGGHGHEIYLKTSSNSSKLLQTPPDTFQTLPNPVQTCPNPVQMRPNTSKCVKTCPNASKCSKLVQICPIYYYSYNSGGEHGHGEIYFKTSSNSSKLLQTPPDTLQTLSNPVQMRPNTSKCVKTCPNASKRI